MTNEERTKLEQELDEVEQACGRYANLYERRPLAWNEQIKWIELSDRQRELKALLEPEL